MGDVGVITGVLDDRRCRRVFTKVVAGERERDAAPRRQCDLDRVGEIAGDECSGRRLSGGSRAGACRPAALERSILGRFVFHAAIYRRAKAVRHEGKRYA
jgi:hypothetical protein